MNRTFTLTAALLLTLLPFARAWAADDKASRVTTVRLPTGGVQPDAAVDAKGVVHLIYLAGDPSKSDVFYRRSADGGATFSAPVRVNSQPGSAIATGTVRGAHLAVGKEGRVHVAWMGSQLAEPKAPGGAAPMLYTRLADDGAAFEPQRNVISEKVGLDGGGTVTADGRGNVYVLWHAPESQGAGEAARRVWAARSNDEGRTFAPEVVASDPAAGDCGCCGMGALVAPNGTLYALYRSAQQAINRDIHLVQFDTTTAKADDAKLSPWRTSACPMSTAALAAGAKTLVAAWESQDQVEWGTIDPATGQVAVTHPIPGRPNRRKHPAVAVNGAGQVPVAWTEGTTWAKGGSLAWQVFDEKGIPVEGTSGRADDLPVWDKPSAFVRPDGNFVVVY